MTQAEKLLKLKTLLDVGEDKSCDSQLCVYLDLAKQEIVNWKYSLIGIPENTEVPQEDETTQIMAVIVGFNLQGVENQFSHNENGINRTFQYASMQSYVRSNVIPYVKLV